MDHALKHMLVPKALAGFRSIRQPGRIKPGGSARRSSSRVGSYRSDESAASAEHVSLSGPRSSTARRIPHIPYAIFGSPPWN